MLEQSTQLVILYLDHDIWSLPPFIFFFFEVANMKEDNRLKYTEKEVNLNSGYSTWKNVYDSNHCTHFSAS